MLLPRDARTTLAPSSAPDALLAPLMSICLPSASSCLPSQPALMSITCRPNLPPLWYLNAQVGRQKVGGQGGAEHHAGAGGGGRWARVGGVGGAAASSAAAPSSPPASLHACFWHAACLPACMHARMQAFLIAGSSVCCIAATECPAATLANARTFACKHMCTRTRTHTCAHTLTQLPAALPMLLPPQFMTSKRKSQIRQLVERYVQQKDQRR